MLRSRDCLLLASVLVSLPSLIPAQIPEYCPPQVENSTKICNLREYQFNGYVWNYYTGYFCYIFTDPARLNFVYPLAVAPFSCNGSYIYLPVVNTTESTIFFDYTDTASMLYVKKSFKTDSLFQNYLRCCREAEDCCTKSMNAENIQSNADYCPAVWDAWTCFPRTKVGTIAKEPCSSQAYQSPDHICTLESQKTCFFNETTSLAVWNQQTDYVPCDIAPVYTRRHKYHTYAFYVCSIVCLPAIIIFFAFEKLRKTTRVVLHRNLLVAIVIRNILTILSKELVILDALKSTSISNNIMQKNTVACRVLSFFEGASKNCIYACMLVDGFYLHKVIVRSFAREPSTWMMYAVVFFLTFVPSLIWATILAVNDRQNCWMVDSNNEQWAVDSFRVLVLACNTLLLLDIIRVMLSKMKHGSTSRQSKAAFRATLFLIPLFGIHIIITAKKIVYDDTCTAEDVYDYARYTMEALQGIFVAVLFCYTNAEVHNALKNAYRKLTIQLSTRFGIKIKSRGKSDMDRRTTTATSVGTEF